MLELDDGLKDAVTGPNVGWATSFLRGARRFLLVPADSEGEQERGLCSYCGVLLGVTVLERLI